MNNENSTIVLVTGALSYLGSHITLQLLQKGYKVRGTVRDITDKKVQSLRHLTANAQQDLEIVQADLLDENCWIEAVKDCTYVCHAASPYPTALLKDEMEIIKPAVEGTKYILQACVQSQTIKRVVLTSSDYAIIGSTIVEGKKYTEEDWSDVDDPLVKPYHKSKTLTEMAAWEFAKKLKGKDKLDLVVINPGYMQGPIIKGTSCYNLEIIKEFLEKPLALVPEICMRIVDVRDVAAVHIAAMTSPKAPGNRYLTISESVWVKNIASILAEEFGPQGYKIAKKETPRLMIKGASLIDKSLKQIMPAIGKKANFQSTKVTKDLGLKFRAAEISIIDMAYSAIESGLIKKKTLQFRGFQRT